MSSSRFIKISSANRDNYNTTSPSDFSLSINTEGLHGVYKLVSVFMSNSYYTFNSNNNKIMFKINDATFNTEIPSGFYDTDSITSAISTAMNTSSSLNSFACTFNSVTQKITITNNQSPFQLLFGSLIAGSSARLLGYHDTDTDLANIQTGQSIANLDPLLSYNFIIDNAEPALTVFNSSHNNNQSQSAFNFNFSVPNVSGPLSYFLYEPSTASKVFLHFPYVTSRLRVRVLDDSAHAIELQSDYQITLERIN